MLDASITLLGIEFPSLGDLATWIGVGLAFITSVIAAAVFVTLRNRERRQALTDLHNSLTSGETAQARNVIGTLLYSPVEDGKPTRLASIEAYFFLIWALQRARNVFRTFRIEWTPLSITQGRLASLMHAASKDAELALTWNLKEIAENIVRFRELYGREWAIADGDAWADIGDYVDAEWFRTEAGGSDSTGSQ